MDKDFNGNCGWASGHKFYNDTVSAIDFTAKISKYFGQRLLYLLKF